MNNYHESRRQDEQLASAIAEGRGRQQAEVPERVTYHYFVSGHTYFADGVDEPLPVNVCTIIDLPDPLLNDEDLDKLTELVKQQLDEEAVKHGLTQQGYPVIRQVNLMHTTGK